MKTRTQGIDIKALADFLLRFLVGKNFSVGDKIRLSDLQTIAQNAGFVDEKGNPPAKAVLEEAISIAFVPGEPVGPDLLVRTLHRNRGLVWLSLESL